MLTRKMAIGMAMILGLTSAAGAQADCVARYDRLHQAQHQTRQEGAAGVGLGGIGVTGAVLTIAIGSTGVGTVALLIVGAGGVYLAYKKHGQEQEIVRQLDVLTLYRESKQYLLASAFRPAATAAPLELRAFAAGLIRHPTPEEMTDMAHQIIRGMEQGVFCSSERLVDSVDLLGWLQGQQVRAELPRP